MEVQENKPQGAFSINDAARQLKQSRERSLQATEEVTENAEEVVEDQANAEIEAETESEAEAAEVEEDQSAEEVEDEVEPQPDAGDVYEVNGVEFTGAELKEWKEGAMRLADYTRKTQEVSKEKTALATERQQFEAEKAQVSEHLQQQNAQLQDALATFAIEQDPEPQVAAFPDWKDYASAKAEWDNRSQKRQQAQQAYQVLQAEEHQATVQREFAALLSKKPEYRDAEVFKSEMDTMKSTAERYGYGPQEFEAISDHRIFLALADLERLSKQADTKQVEEAAAEKKVVKAVKRLTPSSKQKPVKAAQERVRKAQARFDKTGSMRDAVALRKAKREAG